MDYLKTLNGEELVKISQDFNYLKATESFVGLRLLPMVKTENLKVAMYNLLNGADIPVVALVHALDSEARIGDRVEYEEIKAELFLIKEKINQGEELRKKIKDLGMSKEDDVVLQSIYNDIDNQISKVLAGFERRACELLSTGKITINENGAKKTVDFKLAAKNKIDFSGWNDPAHDIIGDLIALQKKAKNKIKRFIFSDKIMGYMLNNTKLNEIASKDVAQGYLTQDFVESYIKRIVKTNSIIVDDRTYKLSHSDSTEYRFFKEDVVIALTTEGTIGSTFMTSTPTEDANEGAKYGFVAVDQWTEKDPKTSYTMAEGMGLPVIKDINNTLYLSTISETVIGG